MSKEHYQPWAAKIGNGAWDLATSGSRAEGIVVLLPQPEATAAAQEPKQEQVYLSGSTKPAVKMGPQGWEKPKNA